MFEIIDHQLKLQKQILAEMLASVHQPFAGSNCKSLEFNLINLMMKPTHDNIIQNNNTYIYNKIGDDTVCANYSETNSVYNYEKFKAEENYYIIYTECPRSLSNTP